LLLSLFALPEFAAGPGAAAAQDSPVQDSSSQDAPPSAQDAPALRVTFLDVGQADAIVVRAPEGQVALIDAGQSAPLGLLAEMGIDGIDLLVATHPHADHIGGMAGVLDAIPVRFYMDNGQPHTTATYAHLLRTLQRHTEVTYLAAEPRAVSLGSARIDVLPLPAGEAEDLNDRSVGLVVTYGSFRAFLSGDSEVGELGHFLARGVVPDVTLLKAPHHGSDNGFTGEFLAAARPEAVVVSVGTNGYGHPRPEAMSAYAAVAEGVYRTDLHGHVTVLGYEDGRFEVFSGADLVAEGRERGDAGTVPARGASVVVGAPGLTDTSEPYEIPPVGSSGTIGLSVFADAPGNDHRNTNGEYAVLENGAEVDVDVAGWRLCDLARHCFRFPPGAVLRAGGRIVVHTGRGASDGVRFFMGSGSAVWNNDGDTATLYDRSGTVVLRHTYE
jgi:competence protein ComEC